MVNSGAPRVVRAADAADPSDLFLNAYMSVQQGEKLEHDGNPSQALTKYKYAAGVLDQISAKYPNWNKLIVDYRKKRTAENIARIEQQQPPQQAQPSPQRLANEPRPAPSMPGRQIPDANPPLPTRDDNVLPLMSGPAMPPLSTGPAPSISGSEDPLDQATAGVRSILNQMRKELQDAQKRALDAQNEKEELAIRLDRTVKQLDQIKGRDAERSAQIKQLTELVQDSASERNKDLESQKALQAQVDQLQERLKDERADRDAIEQVNEDNARRYAKERAKADATAKELATATEKAKQVETRLSEAPKAVKQLAEAQKQIEALKKDREAAQQRAKELDGKLAEASKAAKQLEDAKKQIAALQNQNETAAKSGSEISTKLADAQKQIADLTKSRDDARKEAESLTAKVTDAQNQVAAVKTERDEIAKQRDQALADLAKARDAQQQVDKLLAENTSLMEKLSTAEKTIQQFNTDMPKKDEEIAALKKQMDETKTQLAETQRQNAEFQVTMNDLQQQLDKTGSELAETKASGASSEEKRKFEEENDLLRGIVLRQLKEQARRSQAKKLVLAELAKLEVQSDTLIKQIDYLGQPVVKLSDQEKALFKQPQIEVTDADSMEFTITAPKPETGGNSKSADDGLNPPLPSSKPLPAANTTNTPDAPDAVTSPDKAAASSPNQNGSKSNTPGENNANGGNAGNSGNSASAPPQVETELTPTVPQEMMADARQAKELFERGQYRDAEKIYEKMLAKAPNNIYILDNLGVTRFREQKLKLAEEAFKKAIAVSPQDAFSHCTLGIVYYQQAKYDDAITALTKALAINPKYAVAHNYLGITASQKGWQEAALKELETAITLDPNYADACFNLAVVYATQTPPDKEKARKYYKRATELGAEPEASLEQMIK